jgi:membrane protein
MPNKSLTRLIRIVSGTFGTGKEDLFSLEASLTRFERFVHFWVLVWQSFVRNRCPVRASALSYTTMLALIPMLAVAMSVSSVFLKSKGEEQIEHFIQGFVDNVIPAVSAVEINQMETPAAEETTATPANETNLTNNVVGLSDTNTTPSAGIVAVARVKKNLAKEAAGYIHGFVAKTYSGTLGVTGMFFLVLTAILTLTRVEETFNDIWGVTRGRDWWARVANYFTAIALGPALLIAAVGLMSGSHLQKTRGIINTLPLVEALLSTVLPIAVICITFTLFYKLVPNTKVDFSAALVGGTLAGVSWHFYNQLGFLLASRAVSASAIYGGLALIPLLMGGLYVVWLTVLFGAQVAYAFQNRASYLQEKLADNVNQRGREFVALRLMTCIGQRFNRGLPPVTIREISNELGIPGKLAQQVLHTLLAARLVVEVAGLETGYSPARPLEAINTHHILLAMRATQGQELVTRDEPVRIEVLGEFARIQAAEKEAASSVTMLALVNRAHARLELAPPAGSEVEVQPASTGVLVTTLTAAGLTEEPQSPATEIARPPASSEATPEVEFTGEVTRTAASEIKSRRPVSPADASPDTPLASSTSNDNESFPL